MPVGRFTRGRSSDLSQPLRFRPLRSGANVPGHAGGGHAQNGSATVPFGPIGTRRASSTERLCCAAEPKTVRCSWIFDRIGEETGALPYRPGCVACALRLRRRDRRLRLDGPSTPWRTGVRCGALSPLPRGCRGADLDRTVSVGTSRRNRRLAGAALELRMAPLRAAPPSGKGQVAGRDNEIWSRVVDQEMWSRDVFLDAVFELNSVNDICDQRVAGEPAPSLAC